MRIVILILILSGLTVGAGHAQQINWGSVSEQRANLVYADVGYDFGVTAQFGYGRLIHAIRPVVLTFDYSMPMGGKLTDDFKVRLGGQVELLEKNGFALSGRAVGNFRRHQTSLVRIASFGGEFSLIGGYFRPGFHAALEVSSDGAVASHLKHSRLMVRNYPQIHDGWYLNTGAHYFYGMQASKTIGGSYDVSMRLGKTNARGSREDVLPLYFQLGLMKKY
jgi:hypothetical protein